MMKNVYCAAAHPLERPELQPSNSMKERDHDIHGPGFATHAQSHELIVSTV